MDNSFPKPAGSSRQRRKPFPQPILDGLAPGTGHGNDRVSGNRSRNRLEAAAASEPVPAADPARPGAGSRPWERPRFVKPVPGVGREPPQHRNPFPQPILDGPRAGNRPWERFCSDKPGTEPGHTKTRTPTPCDAAQRRARSRDRSCQAPNTPAPCDAAQRRARARNGLGHVTSTPRPRRRRAAASPRPRQVMPGPKHRIPSWVPAAGRAAAPADVCDKQKARPKRAVAKSPISPL